MHKLGTNKKFYQPITKFRATSEIAYDEIDTPVSWEVYEEAYFLPMVITEKRHLEYSESILATHKRLKELELSLNSSNNIS